MPDNPLYLTIDQGGHASRAIVFDGHGEVVQAVFKTLTTQHRGDDVVEHDSLELVATVQQAIAEVVAALGDRAAKIVAVGLATQRSSIICWNRDSGEPLSPVISWQDRRAADLLAPLTTVTNVRERTGLFVNPHYGASKLKWCLQHLTAVQEAQQTQQLALGPLASFLIDQLVDESVFVVDPANASRLLLMNYQTADWDETLCEKMAIDRRWLPTIVPTRHAYGHLLINGIAVPLVLCTGDQSAALFAQGFPAPENLYINVGTGAFMQGRLVAETAIHPRLLSSVVYLDDQQRVDVVEGTVNGAGKALQWGASQFSINDTPLDPLIEPIQHESLPIFINGIAGVGSPYWRAHQLSYFVGEGDSVHKMLAILESIVFLLNKNWQYFKQIMPVQRIIVSGGVANSAIFCQRLANITGRSVYRYAESEATARGVAYLMANNAATWFLTASIEFIPQSDLKLTQRYQQWQDEMGDLVQINS